MTLTCSDPGNAGTPRYVWINDTDDSSLTPLINNPPLVLSLNSVKRAASGIYTCQTTYPDLPGFNRDTSITLNVQCKPMIRITLFYCAFIIDLDVILLLPQTAVVGTNHTLNCSFDANPLMVDSVTWLHNGTEVDLRASSHISIDTVSNFTRLSLSPIQGLNDSGEYTCFVSNSINSVSKSGNLSITFPTNPNPIHDLMASVITNTSVRLTWSLGFNGHSPLIGGLVSYVAVSNGIGNGMQTFIGETVTELTVLNLQPFTFYNFSVIVMNAIGSSNNVTVTIETLPNGNQIYFTCIITN